MSLWSNLRALLSCCITVPYACTGGLSVAAALTSCMNMPSLVSVTYLETLTNSADVLGTIDHTAHLSNDRIWIFDGINDTKVNPGKDRGGIRSNS